MLNLLIKNYIITPYHVNRLLDISTLKKIDSKGMFKIYDRWPELAKESYEKDYEKAGYEGIDHVVFSGMGASGALGDIFSSILSKTNLHVNVVKGYLLPKTVNKKTLVVITSVSGNTTESLSILKSAYEIGSNIIAFSSGGQMENFCKKNNIKHRKIPMSHSPRASFIIFLFSMLKVLQPLLPIHDDEIIESFSKLNELRDLIYSENLTSNNPSLKLAEWINGIPLIYFPFGLQAVATRFKNSLQENAKIHTFAEDVIEACHNGIVAWEYPNNVIPILIQGEDDYIKTKERWKILKEFFDSKNIQYWDIFSEKGGILTKLIGLIYLLDYATIYRAVLSGIDPTPVDSIDYIKQKL